jgi:hypothetical protein
MDNVWSRDSSVVIAKVWTAEVRFRQGKRISLLHSVHTGSGAAYLMGNGALSPGLKRPGREVDH